MKLLFVGTVFLLNVFNSNSHATSCTAIDLTDPDYLRSIGKEKLINHFSEPRDQDSVGWCGAYASADSLSFAVGEPASALDISLNQYAAKKSKNFDLTKLDGISPNAASNVAQSVGYCPESVIPSNATGSSNLGGQMMTEIMQAFQNISNDFKSRGKPNDYCVRCSVTDSARVIKQALPNVNDAMIRDVLIKFQGDSLASTRELMLKLCEGNRRKISPAVQTFTQAQLRGKNSAEIISNALLAHSMPSIGISANVFSSASQDHEMIVVGQKPGRNGKCQYIIRNSWGRGCSYYIEPFASSCNPSNGTFLMDEDTLKANLQDILIIKNTNSKHPQINARRETKREDNQQPEVAQRNTSKTQTRNRSQNSQVRNNQSNSNGSSTQNGATFENTNNNDPATPNLFTGLGKIINGIWGFFASLFKY